MIATAVLAADYAATLDLSDRSEVRARTTQQLSAPPDQPIPPQLTPLGIDVYSLLQARLHVDDRVWEWVVGYAPWIMLPDLELGVTPQVYQVGSASVAWHDRLVKVTLGEDASYGQINSAYLTPAAVVPGQPPTIQPAAEPATIFVESSRSYVTSSVRVNRRAALTLGVEYLFSGGADAASRAVIPFQQGPHAWGSFDYDVTRVDRLTTYASFQRADFMTAPCVTVPGQTVAPGAQCAPQDVVALAEETLTHKLSRTAGLVLGAGGAFATERLTQDVPYGTTFFPVADASLQVQFGYERRSMFQIYARLAPYVNMLDGIVANNLIGEASLRDQLTRRVVVRVLVGAAQMLPTDTPAATGLVRGEVELDYLASPWLELAVGERGFWQNELGLGTFVSTFGFVGVTVREPTLHF
jgi:hypothetical protein